MLDKNIKKIISVHGVPRSGTSWLAQIIDSSPNVRYKFQPIFSNSFKDRINVRSSKEEIYAFFNELYYYDDEFLDRTIQKRNGIYPVFKNKFDLPDTLLIKMVRYHYLIPHLLKNTQEILIVGIIRHPCAVLNSWKNAPKEFPPHLNFSEQWEFAQDRDEFKPEEYFGFHKWKELAKMFLWLQKKFPEKFYLIRYEQLVKNTEAVVKDLFNFCGLTITEQTINFIQESRTIHKDDTYSVFKGLINLDAWKTELDKRIIDRVYYELKNTELEIFLNY